MTGAGVPGKKPAVTIHRQDRNAAATGERTPEAFLIFANDVDVSALADYETWHGQHHVPQRLTVPGIMGAVRYRAVGAGTPHFLTVYNLADIAVLVSAPYCALVTHPDAATIAMRPHIKHPLRFACRTIAGSTGNVTRRLAVGVLRADCIDDTMASISRFLEGLALPFLLGRVDQNAGGHPAFQHREDSEAACILIGADESSQLHPICSAMMTRWNVDWLPVMRPLQPRPAVRIK